MKWFKRKKRTLPEDSVCRNCGAQTVGRYCHECGQDLLAGIGQPILTLITQVLDNAFALEGKTPRTLVNLLFRPGFLSIQYQMGKIVHYVHPVKLFWMSTLIFFALLISQMDMSNLKNELSKPDSNITIEFKSKPADLTDEERNAMNIEKATDMISTIANYANKFAPYIAFLFIPIFALLLAGIFWRRKLFYVFHLVFAVHFHTFLWIFCSILLLFHIFTPNLIFPGWLNLLLFLIPGVYLTVAIRHFYQPKSWWKACTKTIGVSLLYVFLILIATAFLIILFFKFYYPELL